MVCHRNRFQCLITSGRSHCFLFTGKNSSRLDRVFSIGLVGKTISRYHEKPSRMDACLERNRLRVRFLSVSDKYHIPCSYSLRLLGSLRGALGTYSLIYKNGVGEKCRFIIKQLTDFKPNVSNIDFVYPIRGGKDLEMFIVGVSCARQCQAIYLRNQSRYPTSKGHMILSDEFVVKSRKLDRKQSQPFTILLR